LYATAVERHLVDDVAVDHRSHGCILSVHCRRVGMNSHDGAGISDAQLEIQPGILADFELDAVANDGFKPRSTDGNAIKAWTEGEDAVEAGIVRLGHSPAAGLFAADVDFRSCNLQARGILNQTRNLRSLSVSRIRERGQTHGPNGATHLRVRSPVEAVSPASSKRMV